MNLELIETETEQYVINVRYNTEMNCYEVARFDKHYVELDIFGLPRSIMESINKRILRMNR